MTVARRLDEAVAQSATVAEVTVRRGALTASGQLYRRHFGDAPACLVADSATWAAAGERCEAALHDAGIATRRHVLPGRPRPKPAVEVGEAVQGVLAEEDATPVSVGSGVLTDLVKFAAYRLDRPCMAVATAASMDGYTSGGAPLSADGFKKTLQCRAPRVILADLDVLAAAPSEMAAWGYGDLAGKLPAGADWIVADALGIEPLDPRVWPLVQDDLGAWLDAPGAVADGEPAAIESLFTGLALVGLAMERHGSSRPASGADHQIAHLWEMEGLEHRGDRVSHGACVAVGAATVAALYAWLLDQDLTRLDPEAVLAAAPGMEAEAADIRDAFGEDAIANRAMEETRAKHLDPAHHRTRLHAIRSAWPDLAARLRRQLVPAGDMRTRLRAAGAPAAAQEIGVNPARLRRSVLRSRYLRSRYTLLDLLSETGLLAPALDAVLPDTAHARPAHQEGP